MAVHLKPHLQEGIVAIVDEGQVLQPTNPVRNALNKEARHLHNRFGDEHSIMDLFCLLSMLSPCNLTFSTLITQ